MAGISTNKPYDPQAQSSSAQQLLALQAALDTEKKRATSAQADAKKAKEAVDRANKVCVFSFCFLSLLQLILTITYPAEHRVDHREEHWRSILISASMGSILFQLCVEMGLVDSMRKEYVLP